MKKYVLLMVVGIFILTSCISSCNYLNKKPDNLITDQLIWNNRANLESYLYNIYSYIPESDGVDYTCVGGSDESTTSNHSYPIYQMTSGNWSPVNGYFDYWGTLYKGIRASFIFEGNIGRTPSNVLSDDLKKQYVAESKYLRGYFYWQLLKQYGPVVKLTGALSLNDDFNKYPRSSFETCVDYVNQLMDEAAVNLPVTWASNSNDGRPTKGSCLAVKAEVALLAASPLWNGNSAFANFKNQDGTLLTNAAQYDVNKWKTAATAAKAVIDLGSYKLFTNLDEGGTSFNPYLSVRDVFLTNWNSEIIFTRNAWYPYGITKCASPAPGGYDLYDATQNIVDGFNMNNGRTITDPKSGYQETGFAQSDGANSWEQSKGQYNMYANREPRFYAYINYNARPVLDAPTVDDKNYFSSPGNVDGTGRSEYYYSGKSGQKAAGTGLTTGYGILKNISPNDNIRLDQMNVYRPYIILRYSQILLDYVEALNEYDPGNPDIVRYLDQVRARAGLPGIETVYPEAVGNQNEMRTHILHERQVELCFEGDRYFTLVRRKLLGLPANQAIYSMNTGADDHGQGFGFVGFYNRTLYQSRVWKDKMYLFPISQYEIDRDRSLVQNPGW